MAVRQPIPYSVPRKPRRSQASGRSYLPQSRKVGQRQIRRRSLVMRLRPVTRPRSAHTPAKPEAAGQPRAPTPPPHVPAPPPGAAATGQSVGVVPDRLPPAGDALVWREAELEHLLSILRGAGRRGRKRPPIVVVAGEPGMGKTSLAVRGAHRLRDHFPDGTLFIALGGASRPDTVRALRTALQDLEPEQPSETEPPDAAASLEQLASRYQTAFSGRRILVLVDDALASGFRLELAGLMILI